MGLRYDEYLVLVEHARNDRWRLGQTYFNVLHRLRPKLANRVRGSLRDPFHHDDRLSDFRQWVMAHWEEE